MDFIYARVSTNKQDTDNQTYNLKQKFPDAKVIEETASGAKKRPALEELVKYLRPGDRIIVAALDRLGRSVKSVLNTVEQIKDADAVLVSVRENIDFSTSTGKMILTVMLAIAQLERDLISERTKDSLQRVKADGKKLGRADTSKENAEIVGKLYKDGMSLSQIGEKLHLSKSLTHYYLKKYRQIHHKNAV